MSELTTEVGMRYGHRNHRGPASSPYGFQFKAVACGGSSLHQACPRACMGHRVQLVFNMDNMHLSEVDGKQHAVR